jgi:phosphoenolpyruvate carboxykinase (GTP)
LIDRVEGRAGAAETPIGRLPVAGELDLEGLGLSQEARDVLFGFDRDGWRAEFGAIGGYLAEYGERMPAALAAEQRRIARELAG